MKRSITLNKIALIVAGLALTATASISHAQQQWADQVLDQTRQDQPLADRDNDMEKTAEDGRESADAASNIPDGIDISNIVDEDGDLLI